MPIIPEVGRRTPKIRMAIYLIHALLILGSITMIYPFLLMLSGSVKGKADVEKMDVVPEVLYSEKMQFTRFEEDRYGHFHLISAVFRKKMIGYAETPMPKNVDEKEIDRYGRFLRDEAGKFPPHFFVVSDSTIGARVHPKNLRLFKNKLKAQCNTIEEFNSQYEVALPSWNHFYGVQDLPWMTWFHYDPDLVTDAYLKFKQERDADEKALLDMDGFFFLKQQEFPKVMSGLLKPIPVLSATCPSGPERELWERFVRYRLNPTFIRMDDEGLRLFRGYLSDLYDGSIAEMNKTNSTEYSSFKDIKVSIDELRNIAVFTLYSDFIADTFPVSHMRVDTSSIRYRSYVSSATATMPVAAYDYRIFKQTKKAYLAEILTRNYRCVLEFLVVYGRAIRNTLVFIGLNILAALTVNPIAAYALSRFNLKSTYTLLMFFLATMAFPSAVTMIPNFLLLRELHLLNTYWALVLPGVANGFWIFILKGFFDSIPKEVYESAMMDGASEWTMFWRFTMALSKPILALITLNAFTAAYTAFMFALIICPDEKMWTLMVWLYQLQQQAHQSVIYAALVIAAVPTLLVFVVAQNTIMKGIVIPVEK